MTNDITGKLKIDGLMGSSKMQLAKFGSGASRGLNLGKSLGAGVAGKGLSGFNKSKSLFTSPMKRSSKNKI